MMYILIIQLTCHYIWLSFNNDDDDDDDALLYDPPNNILTQKSSIHNHHFIPKICAASISFCLVMMMVIAVIWDINNTKHCRFHSPTVFSHWCSFSYDAHRTINMKRADSSYIYWNRHILRWVQKVSRHTYVDTYILHVFIYCEFHNYVSLILFHMLILLNTYHTLHTHASNGRKSFQACSR